MSLSSTTSKPPPGPALQLISMSDAQPEILAWAALRISAKLHALADELLLLDGERLASYQVMLQRT